MFNCLGVLSFYTGTALLTVIVLDVRGVKREVPGFLARPPCQSVQQFDLGVLSKLRRLLQYIGFNFLQFVGLGLMCLVLFAWV